VPPRHLATGRDADRSKFKAAINGNFSTRLLPLPV
jgi:hypothetical protein